MNRERAAAALISISLVKRLYYFAEIDSTSDYAAQLIDQSGGSPDLDGAIVIADHQTKGRGRFQRKWSAPPGRGLLFSVVLDSSRHGVRDTGEFIRRATLAAPVAVADAIRQHCKVPAVIKFPNDIHVAGRKLAGILLEHRSTPRANFVVIGIGVNVNQRREELPTDARLKPTSIFAETGHECRPALLLRDIFRNLEKFISPDEAPRLARRMNALCTTLGKVVEVHTATGSIAGTAMAVTPEGALIVRTDSGLQRVIYSGDIHQVDTTDASGR